MNGFERPVPLPKKPLAPTAEEVWKWIKERSEADE